MKGQRLLAFQYPKCSICMRLSYLLPFTFLVLACCNSKKEKTLFSSVPASRSQLTFANTVVQQGESNVLNYPYYFNGGGVATADFNNDGLIDIYFTGNQVPNKLYLNQGDFKFVDITDKAKVAVREGWKTGVTVADVNQDGWLDIYVCRSAMSDSVLRENLLFINNGDLTFSEKAHSFGIADNSYSTQAAFFDFDRDGDLDLFVLNHSLPQYAGFSRLLANYKNQSSKKFGSKLYRNDNGRFVEVSAQAGLVNNVLSFGLGLAVADFNNDDWPDIYVSNDFNEEDYLYINQKDGTFTNTIREATDHVSLFSMGSDAADINNDGWTDIITLDMLPATHERIMMSSGDDNYDKYEMLVQSGFHPQYMRNMLQVNQGDGTFRELGQFAGVSNTDWSWSALWADFDGNGYKDLFITNGYEKDYTNMQFLKFTVDEQVKARQTGVAPDLPSILEKMPSIPGSSFAFRNEGNLRFSDQTSTWGFVETSKANGAAYADFDNDGDLDLVLNAMNTPALLYENHSTEYLGASYLALDLTKLRKGNCIGAKVRVDFTGGAQYFEFYPTRGYQSAMHVPFSISTSEDIRAIEIVWPDGLIWRTSSIKPLKFVEVQDSFEEITARPLLRDTTLINFMHESGEQNDFKIQVLLPRMYSHNGPRLAIGDVDNNGEQDIYIPGARGKSGKLILQKKGQFREKINSCFEEQSARQEEDAIFVDIDNDDDLDLYVAIGGYATANSADLQDLLYLNDGNGSFKKSDGIPTEALPGSRVISVNVNNDEYGDLLVSSSFIPGQYPRGATHQLLINKGDGTFENKIEDIAPDLSLLTGLNSLCSADINGDKIPDVVAAGEWTNIEVFIAEHGRLVRKTDKYLNEPLQGWWNCVTTVDLDGDGDQDIIAGNFGLNSQLKASVAQPVTLVYNDFNSDGQTDPFLCYFIRGKSWPYASRDEALAQVSFLKPRFPDYASYSNATIETIFTPQEMNGSQTLTATTFESVYLENNNGKFIRHVLPDVVQYAPVYSIATHDIDNDGRLDIILGGNEVYSRVRMGKSDASRGIIIMQNDDGFQPIPASESGLYLKGATRDLKMIKVDGKDVLVAGITDNPLKTYYVNRK